MPRYEYRCRSCEATFELSRPMSEAGDPVECPQGHGDTVKLLSAVAVATGGGAGEPSPSGAPGSSGCCGGACGCG